MPSSRFREAVLVPREDAVEDAARKTEARLRGQVNTITRVTVLPIDAASSSEFVQFYAHLINQNLSLSGVRGDSEQSRSLCGDRESGDRERERERKRAGGIRSQGGARVACLSRFMSSTASLAL